MRSQLVATVSHELRTPLTPIASQVELLLDGYPDPLTPGQRSAIEVIDRNLDRLRRLVDDLLTVRRVEQGMLEIHPAPVDLASLVTAQAEQFRPHAERVGVTLTCQATPGPRLMGDADRLGTVIDNLLANALKFTPRGGSVEVRAGVEEGWWEIRVTDTGRGIAASRSLARVRPLLPHGRLRERGPARQRPRPCGSAGAGRGPWRGHLGRERARRGVDIRRPPAGDREAMTDSAATVLIVDDEQDVRHVLRVVLQRAGHEVIEASNGAEALARLRATAPDVVVLDVLMPGENGFSVLARIRDVTDVPVLMLTARAAEADKLRGLGGGADDYVTKPFSNAELVARVGVLLRRRQAARPALRYEDERIAVDFPERRVEVDGRQVQLSEIEWGLLAALLRAPGRVPVSPPAARHGVGRPPGHRPGAREVHGPPASSAPRMERPGDVADRVAARRRLPLPPGGVGAADRPTTEDGPDRPDRRLGGHARRSVSGDRDGPGFGLGGALEVRAPVAQECVHGGAPTIGSEGPGSDTG